MPPSTLTIRHVPSHNSADLPRFEIQRPDGQTAGPVAIPPPDQIPVEGRPLDTLSQQLRWYLEEFLEYPFPPETEHAERVQAALRKWGETAFNALFNNFEAGQLFAEAVRSGEKNLRLQIASNDPTILAWPWEALYRPASGPIVQHCQVERRVKTSAALPPLSTLPKDRVNVLLVIARPYPDDVKYRAVSRRLVELAAQLPVSIHVLRPPTFDQLRAHLQKHPNHYHILHFDGHGAYHRDPAQSPGPNTFMRAREGRLVFETASGDPHPVEAERLSELLREFAVPAVVLNACQSAAIDADATGPYASVAAALMTAGMRNVVAMAYSLHVSGAQQFLPAFYGRLFETGQVSEATRAGRQQMRAEPGRVCARGTFPLGDWFVPVLYQQEPFDFSFVEASQAQSVSLSRLPVEADDGRNPYGFVGRDGAVLELERALRRAPAGILVTGMGGVGKTTLVRGFLKWLEQTNGLGAGVLWFDFREVRSGEYVLNRLGEALTGNPAFPTFQVPQKLEFLAGACKASAVRVVWDNFESARGVPGTSVTGNLSESDLGLLRELLARLRGGATKVLITSRSSEDWLGHTNIGRPVPLRGLDGEERWEFANAVVTDLGLKLDRKDPALAELMTLLRGHPLSMRVVLAKLEKQSAAQLTSALGTNFAQLPPGANDESEAMAFATLRFATDALPVAWHPLLIPLGLHEGYADADYLEHMAKAVDAALTRGMIDGCLGALASAGLVRDVGQGIYELHPLLTSYLRSAHQALASEVRDAWARAFVDVMGRVANDLTPKPLHEQRGPFLLHEGSFHGARSLAERLGMSVPYAALTQALGAFALNTRNLPVAEKLFSQLYTHCARTGDETIQASALHQLGMVAQERRTWGAAEGWYRKSLEISDRLGDERGAANTHHQLGRVAGERRDWGAAEGWYRKALEINDRLGDERAAADAYHNLGGVTQERRDWGAAEGWYRKSLEITERLEDEHGAATTYHQLGRGAQERRDWVAAESWYRKALEVNTRLRDENRAASTYHQLGIVAQEYQNFAVAESWYRKALEIKERLGDKHGAATTYGQLGLLSSVRQDVEGAWMWLLKALGVFARFQDEHAVGMTTSHLISVYCDAPSEMRPRLQDAGRKAGLSDEALRQIEEAANQSAPPTGS